MILSITEVAIAFSVVVILLIIFQSIAFISLNKLCRRLKRTELDIKERELADRNYSRDVARRAEHNAEKSIRLRELKLQSELIPIRTEMENIRRRLERAEVEIRQSAHFHNVLEKQKNKIATIQRDIESLSQAASVMEGKLKQSSDNASKAIRQHQEDCNAQAELFQAAWQKRAATINARADKLFSLIESLITGKSGTPSAPKENDDKKITRIRKRMSRLSVFNVPDFQYFPRRINANDYASLKANWVDPLGLNLDRRALAYMAHKICQLEGRCMGRYATAIVDAVIRCLIARAVLNKGELRMLEIGSLFGIHLASIYDLYRAEGIAMRFSALDPMDGYYTSGALDPVTQVPLCDEVFWYNIAQASIPSERIRLIKHLSTDAKARQEAEKETYNLFMIDGDHSYEGVKVDFERYWDLVEPGGYILFDDYGGPEWPDVKRFVDEEVMPLRDLTFITAGSRTAVFQVIPTPS